MSALSGIVSDASGAAEVIKCAVESIAGFPVYTGDLGQLKAALEAWTSRVGERARVIATVNPHSAVVAQSDLVFRSALLSVDVLVPDGVGVIIASRLRRGRLRKRITGSDVFEAAMKVADSNGKRVFFLGSSDKTLTRITQEVAVDFPNISEVGTLSPPYKEEFDEEDNSRMIRAVSQFAPDVLFVGMTAPKQEKWAFQNAELLRAKVIISIGAVFDFYAGNVKRPASLAQRWGLEWFIRLVGEPRRLWRRTLVSTPKFIWLVLTSSRRASDCSPLEQRASKGR